jgi:thiol:disulfide interchange protein
MRRVFFIMLLGVFAITQSYSQILKPEKWQFTYTQKEKELVLNFTVKLDEGWHIYSHYTKEGGPIPTSLVIDESCEGKYKLIGGLEESPVPTKIFDPTFNMEVKYYEHKATFKQKIEITSSEDFTLKGYLEYMLCNDENCLPPTEYDFEVPVKGVKIATENDNQNKNNGTNKVETKETNSAQQNISQESTTTINNDTSTKKNLSSDTSENIDSSKIQISNSNENNEKINSKTKTNPNKQKEKKGLFIFFIISFISGLLAILTPCIFPMIPMTVSFFMHDNQDKKKARLQATVYGISIILIYTITGTLTALIFGAEFANWLSTHWLPNLIFFLTFFIFALSFFGMFEITLPNWMIEKTDRQADKGGIVGAFFMAFTLVLVSFSCTGPIVGAILVESASSASFLKPIVGMFGFSLAFAIPFTLFAYFPEWLKKLPKSGGWLNTVKVSLGFIELALGLKFLSIADQTYHWHILDREIYLALWIVIFTLLGFYFLGKLRFKGDSPTEQIGVIRLLLAITTFTFVVYMIPGMFGAPLKALSGYLPPQTTLDFDINKIVRNNLIVYGGSGTINSNQSKEICTKPKYSEFLKLPHGLKGYFDYKQAISCAKKLNKPVFIDFTGHGCVNCRQMEANVWSDPQVLSRLKNDFVIVALYVDDKTKLPKDEWVKSTYDGKMKKTLGKKNADFQITRYQVNAQPYYVLLDPYTEDTLVAPRAYDLNIDDFVNFLETAIKRFHDKHK